MRERWRQAALTVVGTTLAVTLAASSARSQVVRGSVTQSLAGTPVVGAVVELLAIDPTSAAGVPPGSPARIASTLTDAAGQYALRAPAPGRYRLEAKRIGVRRWTSPPLDLAAGETRTVDITLEAVEYRLPEVVVTANALCVAVPNDRARVDALWDEARTALDAAEISLRDKLFEARVTRYVRELEPKTLRVLRQSQSEVRGVVASPFTALPAESLSASGYWRATDGGGAVYYGPDARVLLSDAFLGDHCFRPVEGTGQRDGLIGLAFAPAANRPVPEVTGTLWMDARTFELRLVEFGYDRVREGVDRTLVGGEVHFARLANGAWIVRRWHLRVPTLGRPRDPVATEGSAPWILVRPSLLGLSEEGGIVTTDELLPAARPAAIVGVVRDSGAAGALAGVVVRLGGSARSVVTDAKGRFAFDALSPGFYTVTSHTPGYDALGVAAADQTLELRSGDERRLALAVHDTRALTTRLCEGRAAPWGRGTVHLTVRDSASGATLPGVAATAEWMSTVGRARGDSVPASAQRRSDARGMLAFCEVPADRTITVRVANPRGVVTAPVTLVLRAREVRHLDIRLGGTP